MRSDETAVNTSAFNWQASLFENGSRNLHPNAKCHETRASDQAVIICHIVLFPLLCFFLACFLLVFASTNVSVNKD